MANLGASSAAAHNSNGPVRTVKRPRPVKSCFQCRSRKLKCNRQLPCEQCQKSQRDCRYAPDGDVANMSDASDAETPERIAKRRIATPVALETTKGLEPSLQVSATLLDSYSTRLERLERLMQTSKSPSLRSPSMRPQTIASSGNTIRGLTVKGPSGLRTRLFGQNSTRVLLNLFPEAKEFMFGQDKPNHIREALSNIQRIHKSLQAEHHSMLAPITVYVDSMTPVLQRMKDILPRKAVCDQLLQVYISESERQLYRVHHVPTLMRNYELWWEGKLQSDAFLPQLLSMLCIGYRFMGMGRALHPDRDGIHISTAWALVRSWLDGLRGKQLVDYETIQIETLMLMAHRLMNPKNQETWMHLGQIVRMAMVMGLHRDPTEFSNNISVFWGEQRRKLWYTILELDMQMSVLCNMPASIRQGDYTCQPPRNLDDADLYPEMLELPESKPIDQQTDSQVSVYAASTLTHRLRAVDLINRLDSLTDYQQVIDCGKALEKILDDVRFVTPRTPPHNVAEAGRRWSIRTIFDWHVRRTLLALYRPFALGVSDCPHEILATYLRSSVLLITYLDELDSNAPNYMQMWHMHHLILKQDELQGCFSVCYFIKHLSDSAKRVSPSIFNLTGTERSRPINEAWTLASQNSIALSLPRLVSAVEKTLDAMIKRIREIGTDLKDLVSLTVVLGLCQGGTPDQKVDRVYKGLQAVVDAAAQSLRTGLDLRSPLPIPSPTPTPVASLQSPAFMNTVIPPFYPPDNSSTIVDDVAVWDMDFWNPLLQAAPPR